jgi:tetratricopeptide (TPR) repeat protein
LPSSAWPPAATASRCSASTRSNFLAFAKQDTGLAGDLVTRLDRLEAERDDLPAALRWYQGHGEPGDALELAIACTDFWIARGHLSESQRWLERALARAANLPASALHARALMRGAAVAGPRGEYPRATLLYERGLAMIREFGEPAAVGWALNSVGILARDEGRYEHAARLFAEGLERFEAVGVTSGIAAVYGNPGVLARARGDYAEAVSVRERSLELHRQLGHIPPVARNCAQIRRGKLPRP